VPRLRSIGPELVSAPDNDPTNIGTAAVVGACTGYQLSWMALLVVPLLAVVLTILIALRAVSVAVLIGLTVSRPTAKPPLLVT
jgi:Mn2+/Fe2+ NRAMP family transporter